MALGARTDLVSRMIRAAQLDVTLYEEVEADEGATGQAALVVLLVAILGDLAAGFSRAMPGHTVLPIGWLIGAPVVALVGWVIWSYITYAVGTQMFGGTATPGEMLRTLGFAHSPQALSILGFIPLLGGLIRFAVMIWVLVAGVIAIRQALDFSTGKAIFTVLIGWLAIIGLYVVLGIFVAAVTLSGAALGGAFTR